MSRSNQTMSADLVELPKRRPVRNFSASQIQAFLNCQRTWLEQWILSKRAPETPAQRRGKEIHDILEAYLLTGKVPQKHPLGFYRYIEWLIEDGLIPDPSKEKVAAEQQIFLDTFNGKVISGYNAAEGVPLVGFIDVGLFGRDPLEIGDLKTTTNLRYAKTPAELYDDVQMNIYAKWAFELADDIDEIKVTHYYVLVGSATKKAVMKRKSAKTLKVSTTVSRKSVEANWAKYQAIMARMEVIAVKTKFLDLPPSITHCPMYGGCSFKEKCGIKSSAMLFSEAASKAKTNNTKDENMSFKEKIAAAKAKKAAEAAGEESSVEVAATEDPKAAIKARAKAKVKANLAAKKAKEAKAEAIKATKKAKKEAEAEEEAEALALAEAEAELEAEAEAEAEAVKKAKKETAESPEEEEASISPPDAGPRETSAEAEEEIRAKAAEALQKKKDKKKKNASQKRTCVLYMGCAPTKGADMKIAVYIEDWIAETIDTLNEAIKAESGHEDYRLLGYNEKPVALAQAVMAKIEDDGLPKVLVSIHGGHGRDIASVILPFVSDVVSAIK